VVKKKREAERGRERKRQGFEVYMLCGL